MEENLHLETLVTIHKVYGAKAKNTTTAYTDVTFLHSWYK
jgi:hypothetical protein